MKKRIFILAALLSTGLIGSMTATTKSSHSEIMTKEATLSQSFDNVAYPKSRIIKSGWNNISQNQTYIPATFVFLF